MSTAVTESDWIAKGSDTIYFSKRWMHDRNYCTCGCEVFVIYYVSDIFNFSARYTEGG